jgi:hypothetical protein
MDSEIKAHLLDVASQYDRLSAEAERKRRQPF